MGLALIAALIYYMCCKLDINEKERTIAEISKWMGRSNNNSIAINVDLMERYKGQEEFYPDTSVDDRTYTNPLKGDNRFMYANPLHDQPDLL